MAGKLSVTHDPDRQRYELLSGDDVVGHIDYRQQGETLALFHTEIEPALRGRGLGARLVAGALADIRSRDLHVQPLCWFVREYIERNADERDLLAQ